MGQSLVKIISFFYTLFLARSLGVEDFGLLIVALSFFALISSISDFGISRYLIREIAISKSHTKLILNVIVLRILTTVLIFLSLTSVFYLFDAGGARSVLIMFAVIAVIPQSLALSFDSIFVGLQKFSISSIAFIISGFSTATLGILLVLLGFGAFGAITALIFGQLIQVVFLGVYLIKQKIAVTSEVKMQALKRIISNSAPYGVLMVIGMISFKIDSIILSYFRGNLETGLYGASYKILEASLFIPTVVSTVLFPFSAGSFDGGREKIRKVYPKLFFIMGFLGIITVLFYIFVVPELITNFLKDYKNSIDAIKILALSIPLMFIHIPAGQIILSTKKYLRHSLLIYLSILAINVVLAFIIIPKYGFIGASWITVIGEAITLAAFVSFLKFKFFKES